MCCRRRRTRNFGRGAAICAMLSMAVMASGFLVPEEYEKIGIALIFSGIASSTISFGCVFFTHCVDGTDNTAIPFPSERV